VRAASRRPPPRRLDRACALVTGGKHDPDEPKDFADKYVGTLEQDGKDWWAREKAARRSRRARPVEPQPASQPELDPALKGAVS